MIIYIDTNYRCHLDDDGTMTAIEVCNFDGICPAYIEGYRYVPAGHTWMRGDGVEFRGEMISPAEPYTILAAYQTQYEADIAALDAAYTEGVNDA